MTLGLLICDHVGETLRSVSGDYPDMFASLFARYAPEVALKGYDVQHGVYPQTLDDCEGYLITGSRASVYDDDPWILGLQDFVHTLYQEKQKVVGICFGHQMMAQALGGSCVKSDKGWGVGVHEVAIVTKKSWMNPGLDAYKLIVSHQDQVVALPPDSEVLGGNAQCPYAMMTVGNHFLGIQAHPEYRAPYARALMETRVARIGEAVVQEARRSLEMEINDDVMTRWIVNFFRASRSDKNA